MSGGDLPSSAAGVGPGRAVSGWGGRCRGGDGGIKMFGRLQRKSIRGALTSDGAGVTLTEGRSLRAEDWWPRSGPAATRHGEVGMDVGQGRFSRGT
jgi:hypothetical protein